MSLLGRVLAQYLIDHQLPFIGFDTDRSHGALMRFYADYARRWWWTATRRWTRS